MSGATRDLARLRTWALPFAARARDLLVLTKPRIASFVALAAVVGALLAQGPGAGLARAIEAGLWTGILSAGAGAFNQVLEQASDALMRRTAGRPLPSGRLRTRDAILFAAGLAIAGTVGLALSFNELSALLGLGTLAAYTLVYTPLKRVSSFNTLAGAIPGAAPPLIGYVALAGEPGRWGWALFAILFAWQFPHFLAIAWLHREDYARAGMKMLPALPDTGGFAGRQAFLYAIVLIPVSILPSVRGEAGLLYAGGALVLGLAYAGAAAAFALGETPARARALLVASLVYLPLLFSCILLDPVVRWATTL